MNKYKKPVRSCPSCGSKHLLGFEGDHFCLDCSWDSLKLSVDRGDLDNIFDAANDALEPSQPVESEDSIVESDAESIDWSAA